MGFAASFFVEQGNDNRCAFYADMMLSPACS